MALFGGTSTVFGRQAPVDVNVRIDADVALRELDEWIEKTDDLRPAFRRFDRQVTHFARQQWASQGFTGGSPWPEPEPETIEARAQNRGGAEKALWDTGEMRASLIDVGPRSVRVLDRHEYTRGSMVPYAGFAGDPEGPRPVFPDPAPSFLERALEDNLADYFDGTGAFAGF